MSVIITAHWLAVYSHESQGMYGMDLRSRGTTGTYSLAALYRNLECMQILFFAHIIYPTQLGKKGKGFPIFAQLIIGLEATKPRDFHSQGQ